MLEDHLGMIVFCTAELLEELKAKCEVEN